MTAPAPPVGTRPILLLVTAHYPYLGDGGENAFVPPELAALARRPEFAVVVAPLRRAAGRLDLPPGVALDDSLALALRRGRLRDMLLAWRWPGFGPELRRALRSGGIVGVARVWRWAAVAVATWRWLGQRPLPAVALGYTYWRSGTTLALARWAAQDARRAAITRVHRYELYEDAFRPPFQPWESVYAGLAFTAAVSAHGYDYLRARGVPASALHLARLGTAAALARSRPSSDGVLRVVSCSFLRPVKRVPLLARALVLLARRRPAQAIAWTHLGEGSTRREVEAALAGAPPNLRAVLRGQLSNEAVRAHYAEEPVDLFVQVSASEGLPVAVMEALAAGVPVLATAVGGVAEAVDATVGALLPADPDAATIAAAVASVLDADPAQRQALRDAACARWAERFDAGRQHADFALHLARRVEALAETAAAGAPR